MKVTYAFMLAALTRAKPGVADPPPARAPTSCGDKKPGMPAI